MNFGRFELQTDARRLLQDGEPVALGARAFDVLVALAHRRDRVVTKAEMLDLVWPGLVVEENNLQVQISTLRKLLGPQAIGTIPGRGYRFCATVVTQAVGPDPTSDSTLTGRRPLEAVAPLVGRNEDLSRLLDLLQVNRFATIVGVGGVGKTSLARAIALDWAHAHAEDAVWVDLAPILDPALILPAVAAAARLQLPADRPELDALAALLAHQSVLLILDNAEHLAEGVAALAGTLAARARNLKVLVTSRQPLRIPTEAVYRLEGLKVPAADLAGSEIPHDGAVTLFAMRARAADARFELAESNAGQIIEICRQLDGLPLAIEMAAARVLSLGVSGVLSQLREHWAVLSARGRNVSPRHRTLRATLDWSHALLESSEQVVFRRAAIFNGGFTLDAACAIAALTEGDVWEVTDALAGLIDKSMVVADASDPPRYRLLETVRAYGLEQLTSSGEFTATRARHASWCLSFFRAADDSWWDRPMPSWAAEVEPEMGNLRTALAWSLDDEEHSSFGVELAAAVLPIWARLGLGTGSEVRAIADRAVALTTPDTGPSFLGRLYSWRGIHYGRVDAHVGLASLRRGLELPVETMPDRDRACALLEYARILTRIGGFEDAERALFQAQIACDRVGLPKLHGLVCLAWGFLHNLRGPRGASRPYFEQAILMFDKARAGHLSSMARNDLADSAWADGDLEYAASLFRQVVEHSHNSTRALGDQTGIPQMNLAGVLAELGNLTEALSWAKQAYPLLHRSELIWPAYDKLALMALLRADFERAALLQGLSDARYAAAGRMMREPNEARMHASVALALQRSMDPASLTQALGRGALLDDEEAWRIGLQG